MKKAEAKEEPKEFEEDIVMPKQFNASGAKFKISPIQDFLLKQQMSTNEAFARAYFTEMTKVYFDFLQYKIENRENISIGLKGQTRSGKSAVASATAFHVAHLIVKIHYPETKPSLYYNINNICANESEYAYKVKEATENSIFHIDEQRESKFQMGSVREELYIMDVQNIIAKANIHSLWLFPTDFIERNCQLGLETIGKDTEKRLTKLLVYDLSKSKIGFGYTPLGYIIMPVKHLWTCKEIGKYGRCDTFGKPLCPNFPTCPRFVATYERKKNTWIQKEKDQEIGEMQEQRFKMGEQLAKSTMFQDSPNQRQRVIIARNLFPQLTEGELREIIEIAKMGITFKTFMKKVDKDKDKVNIKKKEQKDKKVIGKKEINAGKEEE